MGGSGVLFVVKQLRFLFIFFSILAHTFSILVYTSRFLFIQSSILLLSFRSEFKYILSAGT